MILAQVAVDGAPLAPAAHAVLVALLGDSSRLAEEGLAEAGRRRAANPTMSRREVELLPVAERLVRRIGGLPQGPSPEGQATSSARSHSTASSPSTTQ